MPADLAASPLAHIVDDDAAVRRSLATVLRAAGIDVQVHESGDAFLRAADAGALRFGCVLLDIRMPGADGMAVLRAVAARGLRLPVVMVTAHGDVPLAVEAMKLGACDFIEKPYSVVEVLRAVEGAFGRGRAAQAQAQEAAEAAARIARLTRRENQVLHGMVAGMQNKAIAMELGLSPRTVEIHRANAMAKLGAKSLSEAVRIALTAGFGGPGPDRETSDPEAPVPDSE